MDKLNRILSAFEYHAFKYIENKINEIKKKENENWIINDTIKKMKLMI